MFTGTGLAQPRIGSPLNIASSGSRIVPIGSMWTSGFNDTRPEQARGRIAEPIGRPRVRGLVNRQRDDHDGEPDQNRRNVQRDG